MANHDKNKPSAPPAREAVPTAPEGRATTEEGAGDDSGIKVEARPPADIKERLKDPFNASDYIAEKQRLDKVERGELAPSSHDIEDLTKFLRKHSWARKAAATVLAETDDWYAERLESGAPVRGADGEAIEVASQRMVYITPRESAPSIKIGNEYISLQKGVRLRVSQAAADHLKKKNLA